MDTERAKPTTESEENGVGIRQLKPGTTLADRYLIQGVIGVGGMGAVYSARDLHFPNAMKLVAVKEMVIMASNQTVARTIVRNFEREANILATLDHRAIPRIYDYFTLQERSYLIIEYINGRDLETILQEGDTFISEERVLTWAIELCDVLHFLHTRSPQPIIFRDMKPSNIMINPQDHVILVDFGIARTFQSGQKGTMIGTEGYSPPEQYRGEATPLADIYALGATLHHVLTRRDPRLEPPFSFGERPIRMFNPAVSKEMEAVISTALQYEPANRFQSALSMKEALLDVARKNGTLPFVLPRATKDENSNNIKPVWIFECGDEIRGSATYQEGEIYIGSYDKSLYALQAENGGLTWKYETEGGIVSKPAVFENNLVFGSEDNRLYVLSAVTGRINWSYFADGPIRSSPSIASGHIFVGSDDRRLHAINAISGRRAWSMDTGSPIRSSPLVDHDSIYFGTEVGDFYCLTFSGSIRWRFSARRAITSSPVLANGVVYFGSVDSTVYALDAKTGWVIWRFRLDRPTISTPFLVDNLLYIGCVDNSILCLDVKTAKEVWRFSTENQVTSSPIIYRNSLYCGSIDGNLYSLESSTGRLRWKYKTGGPVTGTPVAVDDMIYIGSTDCRVYALLA